jgi:AraC-like DNA-binding protein
MDHLNAFTVARTHNVNEMRGILSDIFGAQSFELQDGANDFSVKAAYFNFGSSSLTYCAQEGASKTTFRDDDYIRLQVCTAGSGLTTANGRSVTIDPNSIGCSPAEAVMEFGPSFEQYTVRIERSDMERDLTSLLGFRPKERIVFDPVAGSGTGQTRRLRETILHAANSIGISDEAIPPLLLREMDQSIRVATLYGMPNNFTDILYSAGKMSAPWQVKRVEEWIDAHWREPVSIETLAEVSGSSARSIFETFKESRGYTPKDYLKRVRLHAARGMLLVAQPDASVTAIAFACQFANPGHFARDYQSQFGELPSATLHRARLLAA